MSTIEEAVNLEGTDDTLAQIDALLSPQGEPEAIVDEPEQTPLEEATPEPEVDESQDLAEEDEPQEDEPEETVIDYELEIPLGDGLEPVKLGELKDAYQNIERERSSLDKQRMAVIADEQELNQFMQSTGVEVPQGFKDHMQKQQHDYLADQHQLMIKMMPELKDKVAFDSMRKGIVEAAAESNFTEAEIAKVGDARIVHLLNRLAVYKAKELKAQETVAKIKAKPKLKSVPRRQTAGKSKLDKQVSNAMSSNNQDDKDKAIAALLNT